MLNCVKSTFHDNEVIVVSSTNSDSLKELLVRLVSNKTMDILALTLVRELEEKKSEEEKCKHLASFLEYYTVRIITAAWRAFIQVES